MNVTEFDYELDLAQIAQVPASQREFSRLLVMTAEGTFSHHYFHELKQWLQPGDVMVINQTRVSSYRLVGLKKDTGGLVSLLCFTMPNRDDDSVRAMAKPLRRLRPGTEIQFNEHLSAEVVARDDQYCSIRFHRQAGDASIRELLGAIAEPALPPYIHRGPDRGLRRELDRHRYQTVYACVDGSIAAPTAGLHFSISMLEELTTMGITIVPINLAIGVGTFRPIRTEKVEDHVMDYESYSISSAAWASICESQCQKRRLIAVGTTTIRALESAAAAGDLEHPKLSGSTDLFIYPGYQFRLCYSAMITNFHLPRSTLLLLVSAFGGLERVREGYALAVREGYRFYSYGDVSMIFRMNADTKRERTMHP